MDHLTRTICSFGTQLALHPVQELLFHMYINTHGKGHDQDAHSIYPGAENFILQDNQLPFKELSKTKKSRLLLLPFP